MKGTHVIHEIILNINKSKRLKLPNITSLYLI
jgi:hypothetical protein